MSGIYSIFRTFTEKQKHQHTLQFFVVTNFAVWPIGGFYPKTTAGLVNCVMAGVLFFCNSLAGGALYAGVLFGGSAFAERMLPATRLQSIGTNCELIAGNQSRQSADAIIARR